MKRVMHLLAIAVFLLACWSAAWAEETTSEPSNGTVVGILTAKGNDWIEVKADGEKTAVRYMPYWRGGMPKDGGGYDQAMLKAIKALVAPNRVKVVWEFQERRRIVSVEMLLPEEKEGTVTGKVTAKGENWIEITPDKQPPVRYWPRWIGGLPKDGGGLDKAVLATIKELNVGDWAAVKWTLDERLRAAELRKVDPPAAATETAK
jgi:hypothetical protein